MVSVGILPSHAFFQPTSAFWEAMEPFAGKPIVDVGAGLGHVTDGLNARGHRALAIDIGERDEMAEHVLLVDGTIFPYPSDGIALFCRPCHGDRFVAACLRRAQRCGASSGLYAGFGKNLSTDLGAFRTRLVAKRVGQRRESLYEVLL